MELALRTGILAAALLAGAVALGLTRPQESGRRDPATGADGPARAAPAVTLQAAPALEGAASVARQEPSGALAFDQRSRPDVLRALVERLARRLRSQAFHEPTWDTELGASARRFEGEALAALAARQAGLSDDEALVLGGLLCARLTIDREPPRGDVEGLVERFRKSLAGGLEEHTPDAASDALALRTLAALGSTADARRLLTMAASQAPGADLARRALVHAGDPCVPRSLAALAAGADGASWTLAVLESLERRAPWRFDHTLRAEVAAQLAAYLDEPRRERAEQALAARALAAWSPSEALLLLRSAPPERPFSEPERALLRGLVPTPQADEALGLVVARLLDPDAADDPLALAEDLVLLPGGRVQGAPWSGPLSSVLERAALESPDPARRRRALRGLQSLSCAQASPALRALAEDDADASVRGLAARMLAADPASRPLLERLAGQDPEAAVRALAARLAGQQGPR